MMLFSDDKDFSEECAICLLDLRDGQQRIEILPHCKHEFHEKCLDWWLVVNASCPTCRDSLILQEMDTTEKSTNNTESNINQKEMNTKKKATNNTESNKLQMETQKAKLPTKNVNPQSDPKAVALEKGDCSKPKQRGRQAPQVRASLKEIWKIFDKHGEAIPDETLTLLSSTPFHGIFSVLSKEKLKEIDMANSAKDIERMVKMWSVQDCGFKIGKGIFRITEVDVETILGLKNKGHVENLLMKIKKPDHPFINKYFDKLSTITEKDLKIALHNAIECKQAHDVAVLLVMLLLDSFLFPTTCTSMSWVLVSCCFSLKRLGKYAWGKMVLHHLVNAFNKKASAVAGCTPLIMYWVAEYTEMIPRVKARLTKKPTFYQWKLNELHKKFMEHDDGELQRKMQIKEERLCNAFKESRKKNDIFYYEEGPDDLDMPDFDLWKYTCKSKAMIREQNAMCNIVEIIESLEHQRNSQEDEASTQTFNELIKKITLDNDALKEQNSMWWEVMKIIEHEKR